MRTLTLHPASLVLGLVLGGIALLSMSQAIVANSPLRIEYAPHPRDMIVIKEGTPYVVPAGRILVVTALGDTNGTSSVGWLKVNGLVEVSNIQVFAQNPPTLAPLPTGFTASPGSVVEVVGNAGGTGRAWGYVAGQ